VSVIAPAIFLRRVPPKLMPPRFVTPVRIDLVGGNDL